MSRDSQGTILSGYGLAAKVGPWSSTPKEQQILNSRAGGDHAGNGNWWQSFNPKPYIQTQPSSKQFNYQDGPEIFNSKHFEVSPESKIPGITRSSRRVMTGNRTPNFKSKSPYGIVNSVDVSTSTDPMPITKKETSPEDIGLDSIKAYYPESATATSNVSVGPSPSSATSIERALRYDPPDPDVNMIAAVNVKRHQRAPLRLVTRGLKPMTGNDRSYGTEDQITQLNNHIDSSAITIIKSPRSDVSEKSQRPKKIVAISK